jgi:hypothetical protein
LWHVQVLKPIQELKPMQEQITNLAEAELKALAKERRRPQTEVSHNLEKIWRAQQECLSLLNGMKRSVRHLKIITLYSLHFRQFFFEKSASFLKKQYCDFFLPN